MKKQDIGDHAMTIDAEIIRKAQIEYDKNGYYSQPYLMRKFGLTWDKANELMDEIEMKNEFIDIGEENEYIS